VTFCAPKRDTALEIELDNLAVVIVMVKERSTKAERAD